MFKRTVSPDDLFRLKREREAAGRAYNEALTALDSAVQQLQHRPGSLPEADERQLGSLNELSSLEPTHAGHGGWRGLIQSVAWRVAAPLIARQQAFNAAVVDHANRTAATHRDLVRALESALKLLHDELADLARFETQLITYAQRVTPYVDTKDYEIGGLMRRINEDVAESANDLERRLVGLAGALSGISDELQKRWESMVARERRFEARVDELRATSAGVHRVSQALKRELTRLPTAPAVPAEGVEPEGTTGPPRQTDLAGSHPSHAAVDSYKYVAFEDLFRGSDDDIRGRLSAYLPYFDGTSDVLDAGCGRGEFLELLRDRGITARGVDMNHEMVRQCRARGLTVHEGDLLHHLAGLPDQSLGGLFAAQVVEHLEPAYLLELLDTTFDKLRPGAKIVLETINVASWSAFFHSYVRDITHIRPLHPDTLSYLVTVSGFQKVEVVYRSPCAEQNKLEEVPSADAADPVGSLAPALNRNVEKLNALLFGDQDYAVLAVRP